MLRITVVTEDQRTVLKAEGKLSGPWVKELDNCWQLALNKDPSETIVLDLSDVAFVDSAGKELIRKMCGDEVELIVRGPLMTSIANEVRAKARSMDSKSKKEIA